MSTGVDAETPGGEIPGRCPHPACDRALPALMWACSEHWQGLPPVIRQGIWSAMRCFGRDSRVLQNAEARAFTYWSGAGARASARADAGSSTPRSVA